MMLNSCSDKFLIDSTLKTAPFKISNYIYSLISSFDIQDLDIIVLCIGTDRSTGDALGPLVGYKLSSFYNFKNAKIYGTLFNPVHAKNISDNINNIYSIYNNPFVIAIDAALGKVENIGKIIVHKGPLYPGAGVNKVLPSVGDISITGIVNISGFMEIAILQSTRLSLVMTMADAIALSLYMCIKKVQPYKLNVSEL